MIVNQPHCLACCEVMDKEHMLLIDTSFTACVMCRNGSRGEDSYSLRNRELTAL